MREELRRLPKVCIGELYIVDVSIIGVALFVRGCG